MGPAMHGGDRAASVGERRGWREKEEEEQRQERSVFFAHGSGTEEQARFGL